MPICNQALSLNDLDFAIVRNPLIVSPTTTVLDAIAQLIRERSPNSASPLADIAPLSCLLVVDSGQLLGIFTQRDVLRLAVQQRSLDGLLMQQVMTTPVISLSEAALTGVEVAANLLRESKIRYLPILNEQGYPVGVVTSERLHEAIARQLQTELAERQQAELRLQEQLAAHEQAETTLKNSEAHQRALMRAIPDLIMRINQAGIYLEFAATPNFRVVGNIPEMVGTHVFDTLPLEMAQKRLECIQRALQTKSIQIYEQDLSLAGITQVEEVRVVPYSEDEVLVLVRDISERARLDAERKQAELALAASEARIRAVLSAIPDLMFQVGADGVYRGFITHHREWSLVPQHVNPTEQHMADVLPAPIAERQMHYLQKALQTGELQIYEQQVQVGGSLQDEEVRVIKSGEDEVLFMVRNISDRKRAEAALQQSEQTNRIIIETLPDLLIQMDRQGRYSRFSGGSAVRVKHPFSLSSDPTVYDILPPDLAEQRLYYANQAIDSGSLQIYEQVFDFEGDVRWEEVRIAPLNDQEVLVIIRDITDRKHSENQRKQAEAALRYLMESTAAVTGQNFFSTLAQQLMLALEIQQVLVTKLVGDHLQTLAYWKDGTVQSNITFALADAPCCAIAIKQGQFYCPRGLRQQFAEYPMIQSLQAESYLGISLTTIEGQRIGNLCILDNKPMEDIQWAEALLRIFAMRAAAELERQQATEALEQLNQELEIRVEQRTAALRDSEMQLSTIFNQAAVGMNLAAIDGRYLKVNQKLCDILGYTPEELLSKNFKEVSHPEDVNVAALQRQQLYAGVIDFFSVQKRCLRKDGSTVWVNLTVSLVRKSTGEPNYSIGILEDISARAKLEADRKLFEEQLQQSNEQLARTNVELARATHLKDEFLANMSHELRTPLNAILGMAEGLQERVFGEVNERQQRALQTIERSGSHLLELINDILDVAKIEAGLMEIHRNPTGVAPLCQSSLTFVKQQALKKGIQLAIKMPLNLPDLWVDERRIRQVLINLLNNAVKFTPEQGRITLEVSYQPSLEWSSDDSLPQNYLRIAVSDTGIGIAPEHIDKLFQPFIQIDSALNRKYQGTGLGLALVKRIVELHGGQVSLTSQVGIGSCFMIDLPCIPAASPAPGLELQIGNEPDPVDQGTSPLILLAEDNEANISTLSSYLNAKGYRILIAKNGRETLHLAQSQTPNLILMDIQMPEMDGLETIQQIRRQPNLRQVPIVVLTALVMDGDRERCLAAGATDYLTKPFKLKQLVINIQRLLLLQQDEDLLQ